MKELKTINDVLVILDDIIQETEEKNDTLGYFAVLYRKVTLKVKEEMESGYFEDSERMEQLDVIFAKRYIDAYYDYRSGRPVTQSWDKAFKLSKNLWPVTLQHLLIGMNAHINLDLGIVAAEVCKEGRIEDLRNDFYKINEILSSLVNEVQHNLCTIWPPLRSILLMTGQYDNLMVDFSMKIARDGAWNFATELSTKKKKEISHCIENRDAAVAKVADVITNNRLSVRILLAIVRLSETGTVSGKIRKLKKVNTAPSVTAVPGIS